MDHYPSQEELRYAMEAYALGLDSCHDREVLSIAGGPGYQHLSGCECGDLFGATISAIWY